MPPRWARSKSFRDAARPLSPRGSPSATLRKARNGASRKTPSTFSGAPNFPDRQRPGRSRCADTRREPGGAAPGRDGKTCSTGAVLRAARARPHRLPGDVDGKRRAPDQDPPRRPDRARGQGRSPSLTRAAHASRPRPLRASATPAVDLTRSEKLEVRGHCRLLQRGAGRDEAGCSDSPPPRQRPAAREHRRSARPSRRRPPRQGNSRTRGAAPLARSGHAATGREAMGDPATAVFRAAAE